MERDLEHVNSETLSLGDVSATVARRWKTAGLVMLATVAAAAAVGHSWPVSFEATAVVAVSPLALDANGTRPVELNIATERVIVRSRQVATAAAEALGPDIDPGDLQDRVVVGIPTDSDTLEITVTDATPAAASETANAFATAYLEYRQNQGTSLALDLSKGLKAQIETLLEELPEGAPPEVRIAVQQQVAILRSQQSALIGTAVSPGAIVSRAVIPAEPSSPGLLLFLAAGIAAGGIAGFGAALARDRLDPNVGSPEQLKRCVPCMVVDGRKYDGDRLLRHVGLLLDALRHELGLPKVNAPPVIIGTSSMRGDSPLKSSRPAARDETKGGHPASLEAGQLSVAQSITTRPRESMYVIVCQPRDRLREVTDLIGELEDWGRQPALVVVSPRRSSAWRLVLQPLRMDGVGRRP